MHGTSTVRVRFVEALRSMWWSDNTHWILMGPIEKAEKKPLVLLILLSCQERVAY